MNNNPRQPLWLKALTALDKVLSIAAISYGIYLYTQVGVFNNGEIIQNPMSWIIGGTVSLLISIVNVPNLFLRKMKKNMVVSR